jgi:hypothetical protein
VYALGVPHNHGTGGGVTRYHSKQGVGVREIVGQNNQGKGGGDQQKCPAAGGYG